ncbi:FmdB family zinc ribbon protein [Thalassoglobus polymorphus]|uniref:FmdB family zinc ribbon protein n=1 Tax=Thalassoglobus polymorphus TaxID=2527994 RepID=UPI0011AAE0FF|nr:zinc ribbon domain-containing protein [Thalassoglobus polymorphus]
MPTFEYHCQKCEQEVEVFVRGQEKPVCPSCQSQKLEKLISAPAGRVSGGSLPVMGEACPPSDAPPCNPNCCRLP